jgi:histidine ammonia-lyase
LRGNRGHFDERIFLAKPHPGQFASARWIAQDIEYHASSKHNGRIQDRYSIRCAPHVIGVLLDSLTFIRGMLEIEINSANDNPLLDSATGDVLHGGNFYGGHPCMAMDILKNGVANIADLIDRPMAQLCNPHTNNGLPADLVARSEDDRVSHHGFKAMQITTSALAAESLKLTMPASVFSRSTESHNQDKVSMGTIAARDALRVLELTETVLAIVQLALCQAVDLRDGKGCHGRSRKLHDAVRKVVPINDADRRQDIDIHHVLELYRSAKLPIGEIDFPE